MAMDFYAGRMEKDSENLYIFGWTPTKVMYNDFENYDWAGNLVVHQLKQRENGELYPVPVQSVVDKISNDIKNNPLSYTETIRRKKNTYNFSGEDHETVKFDSIEGINKITGKINLTSDTGKFGFMFNVDEENLGTLNIAFDVKKQEVQFYNTSTEEVLSENPQSTMPLSFNGDGSLDFTILIDNSIVVVYINDEAILSSRMFLVQGHQWGIFSMDNNVVFEDITLSK